MAGRLFTRRAQDSGWLRVRLANGDDEFLPEYTAVDVIGEAAGRTRFIIADGSISAGKEASVSTANAGRFLLAQGPGGAASMQATYRGAPAQEVSPFKGPLEQQWATLLFDGKSATVTLNSVWDGSYSPIPPGTHAILSPDRSHANIATTGYVKATPGMIGNDVWFPIGLDNQLVNSSRYVHVGHLSEGCVTVHQLDQWTAVYEYLISHRAPGSGGRKVGTITVRK